MICFDATPYQHYTCPAQERVAAKKLYGASAPIPKRTRVMLSSLTAPTSGTTSTSTSTSKKTSAANDGGAPPAKRARLSEQEQAAIVVRRMAAVFLADAVLTLSVALCCCNGVCFVKNCHYDLPHTQDAIQKATSVDEVQRLEQQLREGRVPGASDK